MNECIQATNLWSSLRFSKIIVSKKTHTKLEKEKERERICIWINKNTTTHIEKIFFKLNSTTKRHCLFCLFRFFDDDKFNGKPFDINFFFLNSLINKNKKILLIFIHFKFKKSMKIYYFF